MKLHILLIIVADLVCPSSGRAPACGGTLTARTGVIASPGWADKYKALRAGNYSCTWSLKGNWTWQVYITMKTVELGPGSRNCTVQHGSYLAYGVYNSTGHRQPALGVLCGRSQVKGELVTPYKWVWVQLVVNYTHNEGTIWPRGVNMHYMYANTPLEEKISTAVTAIVVIIIVMSVMVFFCQGIYEARDLERKDDSMNKSLKKHRKQYQGWKPKQKKTTARSSLRTQVFRQNLRARQKRHREEPSEDSSSGSDVLKQNERPHTDVVSDGTFENDASGGFNRSASTTNPVLRSFRSMKNRLASQGWPDTKGLKQWVTQGRTEDGSSQEDLIYKSSTELKGMENSAMVSSDENTPNLQPHQTSDSIANIPPTSRDNNTEPVLQLSKESNVLEITEEDKAKTQNEEFGTNATRQVIEAEVHQGACISAPDSHTVAPNLERNPLQPELATGIFHLPKDVEARGVTKRRKKSPRLTVLSEERIPTGSPSGFAYTLRRVRYDSMDSLSDQSTSGYLEQSTDHMLSDRRLNTLSDITDDSLLSSGINNPRLEPNNNAISPSFGNIFEDDDDDRTSPVATNPNTEAKAKAECVERSSNSLKPSLLDIPEDEEDATSFGNIFEDDETSKSTKKKNTEDVSKTDRTVGFFSLILPRIDMS